MASLYCCVFSSFLKDRGKKKSMVGRYGVVYNFFDHFVSVGTLRQFLKGFSFKEIVSCVRYGFDARKVQGTRAYIWDKMLQN